MTPAPMIERSRPLRVGAREASPVPSVHRLRAVNPQVHPIIAELGRIADAQSKGRKRVGRDAGLSPSTMNHWFSSNVRPSLPAVEAIAAALGHHLEIEITGPPLRGLIGTCGRQAGCRRPKSTTHRFVRALARRADVLGVSIEAAARASGVRYGTVKAWWSALGNQPSLDRLDAVLRVLGMEMRLCPVEPGP